MKSINSDLQIGKHVKDFVPSFPLLLGLVSLLYCHGYTRLIVGVATNW